MNIFEKTYRDYLARIGDVDLEPVRRDLGIGVESNEMVVPLFGIPYRVSKKGIAGPEGEKPALDVCVILCRYILMCPGTVPGDKGWVTYRGFKNSGPLTVYFAADVERAISARFSGRARDLERACILMSGYAPAIEAAYDVAFQFDALPKVPMVILFNDEDEEFRARCSVLFERRAESYLDAECLAMLGRFLFTSLERAADCPG